MHVRRGSPAAAAAVSRGGALRPNAVWYGRYEYRFGKCPELICAFATASSRPSCVATVALTTSLTNCKRSLLCGIDTYTADTEEALVASIASAAGVDASEVDIESVAFPVKVWIR